MGLVGKKSALAYVEIPVGQNEYVTACRGTDLRSGHIDVAGSLGGAAEQGSNDVLLRVVDNLLGGGAVSGGLQLAVFGARLAQFIEKLRRLSQ